MPYGLSEDLVNKIKVVITGFSEVEEALLIGSRAKGTHRKGSDIDLVLMGDISHSKMLSIKSALNDLNSPYTFDVIIYSKVKKEPLKEHIERVGITLFTRNSAEKTS